MAVGLLPRDFIIKHRLLPLRTDDDGALVIAMTDPLDVVTMDEVKLRTTKTVRPAICGQSAFDEAVADFFSTRGKLKERAGDEVEEAQESVTADDASVIQIVDDIISDAVSMKASDIHLEPRDDSLHVRCRIDGVLHPLREFPTELQPASRAASRSWAT